MPATGRARLVRLADLLPDAQEVGLLLGQDDHAVLVLQVLQEDLDLVADLERIRILELVARHRALALEPEVQDHRLLGDAENTGLDDLTLLDVAEGGLVHVQHRLVFLGRVLVLVPEVGPDVHGSRALRDLFYRQLAPERTRGLGHGNAALVLGGFVGFGGVLRRLGLIGHAGVDLLCSPHAPGVLTRRGVGLGVVGCRAS
jgi:hypothetical protein